VNDLAAHQHRHVPEALGREAEHLQFGGRVPVARLRRRGVVRQAGARHVLPQEGLEGADLVVEDRVLGEHGHAELAREGTEAQRVVAVAGGPDPGRRDAVVVEIKAGGDAGVGRRDVA
jgi:hypothetical protein